MFQPDKLAQNFLLEKHKWIMDDSNTVQKITLAYITQRVLNIITAAAHNKVYNSRKTVGAKLFLLSNLCVLREADSCLCFVESKYLPWTLFFFFFLPKASMQHRCWVNDQFIWSLKWTPRVENSEQICPRILTEWTNSFVYRVIFQIPWLQLRAVEMINQVATTIRLP